MKDYLRKFGKKVVNLLITIGSSEFIKELSDYIL